jgi:hypothetical protein
MKLWKPVLIACFLPCAAFAQDATTSGVAHAVYQWSCANPTIVEPILEWALGGLITLLGLNATLKKVGFTKDSPIIGWFVWGLRKLLADVKPPPAVIAKEAGAILSDPVKGPAVLAAIKDDPVAKQQVIAGALATSALSKS